jgi:hypothetical protein
MQIIRNIIKDNTVNSNLRVKVRPFLFLTTSKKSNQIVI